MTKRCEIWIIALAVLFCSALFISPESFWIDEGNTVCRAMRRDLLVWYRKLVEDGGSDLQMPGYMLLIWGWFKFVGLNEFALRASNVAWLLIATYSLRRLCFAWVALLLSPFVLYYLSELRPYLMQVAGAAVIFSGFYRVGSLEGQGWRRILMGSFILCASSLTGVIWAIGVVAGALVLQPSLVRKKVFLKDSLSVSPVFVILALFYVRSILTGEGPSPLGGNLVLSLGAAGYELLGFMGLGPGRNELRENPSAIIRFGFPVAIGLICLVPPVVVGGVIYVRTLNRRQIAAAIACIGIPLAIFSALVLAKDFRLLGRHLAPLAVIVAVLLSKSFENKILGRSGGWIRASAVLAVVAGIFSSVQLRFSERHRKDDFRSAVHYALEAMNSGRHVVWAADDATAEVYGVPGKYESTGTYTLAIFPNPTPVLTGDEIVILSKPDINDFDGEIRKRLDQGKFKIVKRFNMFAIYQSDSSL